ncbi:hypothetical protein PIB30_022231 [Stylosanthes scabra]|uniref:Uncharacterized protein n=1 Tax=Stylosanthes scabra TaxID=79078 RepID=A0ABU6QAK3_9FABA|nr:hypothetical protein [Stylosanthes scabra]
MVEDSHSVYVKTFQVQVQAWKVAKHVVSCYGLVSPVGQVIRCVCSGELERVKEIEKLASLQRAKQIFKTLDPKDRSKRILIDGECRLPSHEESVVEFFVVVHEVVDDVEEEEEQRSLEVKRSLCGTRAPLVKM